MRVVFWPHARRPVTLCPPTLRRRTATRAVGLTAALLIAVSGCSDTGSSSDLDPAGGGADPVATAQDPSQATAEGGVEHPRVPGQHVSHKGRQQRGPAPGW